MRDFDQLKEIVIAGDGETAKRLTAELLAAGKGARQILEAPCCRRWISSGH